MIPSQMTGTVYFVNFWVILGYFGSFLMILGHFEVKYFDAEKENLDQEVMMN